MVDKLYNVEEKKLISGFKIKEENILVSDGFFQESGLIENMAQTAALYAGYMANSLGKETPIGYIGGIKDLKIHRLPAIGEDIRSTVEIVNEVMNVQIAMSSVKDENDKELACCELRIFIKEEE